MADDQFHGARHSYHARSSRGRFAGFIMGLPTNATAALRVAGKIAFADIGFDGPRARRNCLPDEEAGEQADQGGVSVD